MSPPLSRAWRIIPAYAGSTMRTPLLSTKREDHPRIRGEHGHDEAQFRGDLGSSPHTRGAQYFPQGGCQAIRIIPAYAGSTVSNSTKPCTRSDHPRIRGEHHVAVVVATPGRGSSPHTRGARR